MNNLTDVNTAGAANGKILKYNGTAWVVADDTGGPADTDALGEGSTNLYFTNARAQAAITGGTGVTVSSGEVSIGQSVGTTDDVTFKDVTVNGSLNSDDITAATLTASGNVIVSGNLTVSGTTTTVNSNTVSIGDNILVLNSDETGSASQDAGFEIERGTDTNVSFLWDETNDRWTIGSKNMVASSFIGNLIGNAGTVTDGVYTSSSVTALNDVTSVGSGAIITSDERTKLSNIAESANNYSLTVSSSETRGGVKIGYAENGKNYPIELDSEKMFVNVPWTDTTYTVQDGGLTQKNFTTTLKSKLDAIEASADVTDAAKVAAAGAVMNTGTETVAGVKTFS